MSGRSDFVALIKEIGRDLDLDVETMASDWVIKLSISVSKFTFIYGYNFDLNGSASQQICGDKNATSVCLMNSGVRCIEHEAFMNPLEPLVHSYISVSGSIAEILEYSRKFEFNVVVKPLKGTGGADVIHARCEREIEAAAMHVWRKDYGVAVSPYVEIVNEIRVVVLRGEIKLMYRKNRDCITGDGVSSVKQLIAKRIGESSRPKTIICAVSGMSIEQLLCVPESSKDIPIEWRHNLGLGSTADVYSNAQVSLLALSAAEALNIKFCSVDVVELQDGTFSVLEVNSGVMMDSFLSANKENRSLAKQIYAEAISHALG